MEGKINAFSSYFLKKRTTLMNDWKTKQTLTMKDCLLESANGLTSSGRTFSKCLFIENYFGEESVLFLLWEMRY